MNLVDAQKQWKRELELEVAKKKRLDQKREARRRIEEIHEDMEMADELGLNPEELGDGYGGL